MNNQKVSVIIPVYNGEKTLRQCLDSVLNQTYKDYEVIVIDNNSTDRTKEIIKEFQSRNEKIKYIFEAYRSRGAARNAGILATREDIIAMIDSDCIAPKKWLLRITYPFVYENEMVVMGFEKDLIKNYWTKNIQKANWRFIKQNLKGKYITHLDTKNFAIKASLMKKLMFDPELKNFEDFDLALRLKNIANIRFIPSIKVKHNHNSSFIQTIALNFDRAFWTMKIFQKYKKQMFLQEEVMMENISIKKFIIFPFWMIFQFVKKPIKETYFMFVSEVSWRLGLIWGSIKR